MSGPKSYSVAVVSPQELERRALAAAMARLEVVARRAAALNARIESARAVYGADVDVIALPGYGSTA